MAEFLNRMKQLSADFADGAAAAAESDDFVKANYEVLKREKMFSAMVPAEFGGGGASYGEMCDMVRTLAHRCPSTALAFSMHQHLIATFRWNAAHGRPGEKPLRAVAAKELVLVSTGAGDWLASSGRAEKAEGGFRITAKKAFASGCPAGNLLVTSAPYESPADGWQVLHFPVPVTAEGVSIREDWRALGMRGTGSHTVVLDKVFVPEESVVLRRPRGQYHAFWDIVLTVAMPMIMSAYTGVAEAAARIADLQCQRLGDDGHRVSLLGEMHNQLTIVQLAHESMVANAMDLTFEPSIERANASLTRKTIVAEAAVATVEKAFEAVGGSAYFRKTGLERLLRDVHAARFHPLPARKQHEFSGRLAMDLGPVSEMGWKSAVAMAQAAE